MSIHSELIGDNVHQPKGADTASNGSVIKALGNGLTSWAPLFISRLLTSLTNTAVAFTGASVTDNTAVATEETSVEELNDGVLDKDALINKNFHAVVSAMNANTTDLGTQITNINTDLDNLTNKVNEIITLLQDLNITRGS